MKIGFRTSSILGTAALAFGLLCVSSLTMAGEGSPFSAEVDPSVYPPSAFEKAGIHAVPKGEAEEQVPSREERDQAFAKVPALKNEIASWDSLEKDLLYIRARALPTDQLENRYPKIAPHTLKALQVAIRGPK